MADLPVTQMSADTSPTTDDLVMTVNNPGGTPGNRKVTIANLMTSSLMNIPYKFAAYSTAAQNSGNGAFAQTLFATKEFDTGNNFASSTFTAPVAGFYFFIGYVESSGTPTIWLVSLFKNGSEFKRGGDVRYSAAAAGQTVTSMVQLALNDTIDIRTFGSSAIAINVTQATCYFQGWLMSIT